MYFFFVVLVKLDSMTTLSEALSVSEVTRILQMNRML
jgi:hypothetical protein